MMTLVSGASRTNSSSNCDTAAAVGIKEFAASLNAKGAALRPSAVKQTLQVHFTDSKGETLRIERQGLRPLDAVATPGPSLEARIAGMKPGESLDLSDTLVAPIRDEMGRVSGFSLFLQGETRYGDKVADVTF